MNLAARLESACKQYGAKILISEFTQRKLKSTYRSREVDLVVVKGKTQPVAIYEVLDFHTEETFPNIIQALPRFQNGLTLYRQKRWQDAIGEFKEVLALHPKDKPSKMYIERSEHFIAEPPPEDWNGVWVMESK